MAFLLMLASLSWWGWLLLLALMITIIAVCGYTILLIAMLIIGLLPWWVWLLITGLILYNILYPEQKPKA